MDLTSFLHQLTDGSGYTSDSVAELQSHSFPRVHANAAFSSAYPVSTLASVSIALAAERLHSYVSSSGVKLKPATIDQRLASLWFRRSLSPIGWQVPPEWDELAGIYQAQDRHIRLHTNAPHHRAVAIDTLNCDATPDAVASAVANWQADRLEAAIVEAGGCAASIRDTSSWQQHPQGQSVTQEPLVHWSGHVPSGNEQERPSHQQNPARPLEGIRILDLTRVLAGPVSTRWLAGYGATVLRIDPQHWSEPGCTAEMSVGKQRAHLDLRQQDDLHLLHSLFAQADVLVHGYRPGALAALGFDSKTRKRLNPTAVDVALNAYGWSGPWSGRRGFDSLVQMSCGIAERGGREAGTGQPQPLPVQALDHATGYLMAASVLHALEARRVTGKVLSARLSLARTAVLLEDMRRSLGPESGLESIHEANAEHYQSATEMTDWGPVKRLDWPVKFKEFQPAWDIPAGELRCHEPQWPV